MKTFGMLFLTLAVLAPAAAQPPAPAPRPAPPRVAPGKLGILPPEADRRFAALKAKVQPSAWSWIEQQARVEARRPTPDPAALKTAITHRFGADLPAVDIDNLMFIVLFQANQDMEADLRDTLARAKDANAAKDKARQDQQKLKSDLDSTSELGETESLRLQMAMDRRSKLIETLSNVLKKISDTGSSIIGNLK